MDSSEINQLLRGSSITFAGYVIELGISFGATILAARYLGTLEFGTVTLWYQGLFFAGIIATLGAQRAVARYSPRAETPAGKGTILLTGMKVALPVSVALAVSGYLLSEEVSRLLLDNTASAPVIRVFALAIPFVATFHIVSGSFRGIEVALPRVVLKNTMLPLARLCLIVGFSVAGGGAVLFAVAYAFPYFLVSLLGVAFLLVTSYYSFSRSDSEVGVREFLDFSIPTMFTNVMSRVLTSADTFVLGYFAVTTSIVGVYNAIYPLSNLILVILGSFGYMILPVFSRLESEDRVPEIRSIYLVCTKIILMVTLPLLFMLLLFPKMVIDVTFGADYIEGYLALQILSIGFFANAVVGPSGAALQSFGKTRVFFRYNLAAATLNVLLNVALIPQYSINGAAVATAISYVFLNVMTTVELYRTSGIVPLTRRSVVAGSLVGVSFLGAHRVIAYLDVTDIYVLIWTIVVSVPSMILVYFYLLLSVHEREYVLDLIQTRSSGSG